MLHFYTHREHTWVERILEWKGDVYVMRSLGRFLWPNQPGVLCCHFGHGFRGLCSKCLIVHLSPQSGSLSRLGTASFCSHIFSDTMSDRAWTLLPRKDAFELLLKCKPCSSFTLLNGVMFMTQYITILSRLCDSLYSGRQIKLKGSHAFCFTHPRHFWHISGGSVC